MKVGWGSGQFAERLYFATFERSKSCQAIVSKRTAKESCQISMIATLYFSSSCDMRGVAQPG